MWKQIASKCTKSVYLLGGAHFTQLLRWFVSSQALLYCIQGRRHELYWEGGRIHKDPNPPNPKI